MQYKFHLVKYIERLSGFVRNANCEPHEMKRRLASNKILGLELPPLRCPRLIAYLLLFAIFSMAFNDASNAQITVTQNANATTLANMLAGSGVTISNITKSCNTLASGTFTNVSSNIGVSQGIVLATGKVTSVPQAASSFASTALTGTGDAQLSTLTPGTVYDPCVLEFDIVPQGDTLSFKYVFASEEYPEFVCSQFNDVFGFFISGPNPAGGMFANKNIATIPGSTLPVSINSVNGGISGTYNGTTWNGSNCISLTNTADYVNNLNPVNPNITYDGMTIVLSAVSLVVPCQTYHLKIAIADVGDRYYDSGVFLQAYSFTSTPYSIAITSQVDNTAYASTYEGCVGGTFTISISQAQATPVTVNFNVTGTATNGVDYNSIPSSVVIPAGQTSVTIHLTPTQDNIVEGAETVTLSVLSQCSGLPTTTATLTINDDPLASLTIADSTLCIGQSTQLTAAGGMSYSWTPAAGLSSTTIANPVATPNATTTYTANITWGTCVSQLSQTIHVSNPAITLAVTPADTVCTGTNVQFIATAGGAVAPLSYLWNNGNTTHSLTAQVAGTYSVTGTDGYGCTANTSKLLVVIAPLVSLTPTSAACFGANSGAVNAVASGGLAPYAYHWNTGSSSPSLSNVAAGNYNLTITDARGCSASATSTVTQPSSALSSSITSSSNVSCFGGNNGSVNLTVSGGTPAYIYNWNGGITTQNRTNLSAGTYTVTATDSKGCTTTAAIVITQPAVVLSASTSVTQVNCFGASTGSINVTVNGGTAPYSYNWGSGVITQNRTNLSAGSYTVTVTDAGGCTISALATITQPAVALNAAAVSGSVSCYGGNNGNINLSVSGGTLPYFYSWNTGALIPNINNLPAGSYNVTVTDAKGCSVTAGAAVLQPLSSLSVSAVANNVGCFASANGSMNVSVNGGTAPYSYSWTGGVTTQNRTNLAAGTYTLTVTDSKGCTATSTSIITQPTAALTATTGITNVSCFGANSGSITLNAAGGTTPYSYNWGGGIVSQNRTNVSAGNYTVTVTDAAGCSITASATITQPLAALNPATVANAVSCFSGSNGSVVLNANGGTAPYSYTWNNGAVTQNISNLAAGTYNVTVTDAKGCSATAAATVLQPVNALTVTTVTSNVSCFGNSNGSINLSVNGGTPSYNYSWGGGIITQNRTGLAAGNYNVTVSDSKGCSATATAALVQPVAALTAASAVTNVNCFAGNNGSISLSVSGGSAPYVYNWGGGVVTQNRSNLSSGTYTVTVIDANGCSSSLSSVITQPATALAAVPSQIPVSCFAGNNGSVTLSVSGGTSPYTYLWNNGATTSALSNVAAGSYIVTVTDFKGCSTTATAAVTQPAAALSLANVPSNAACFGSADGSISLMVSGGTPAYTYNWGGGVTTQNRNNLAAGSYNVTVNDSKGCSATATTVVGQPAAALSNIAGSINNTSCFGGGNGSLSVTTTGGTAPYVYHWSNQSSASSLSNLSAGSYLLTVTDAKSCSATLSVAIAQPVAALNASISGNVTVNCFGGNNGSATVAAAGGTIPYHFNWSNNATAQAITGLTAGVYIVSVTDANACSATANVTIAQPASALGAVTQPSAVACYGTNNGNITLSVTGGTSPYVYLWSDGNQNQNRSALAAGFYQVTVTDHNGCTTNTSAAITQPTSAVLPVITANNVGCFGANTGSVQVNVIGGTSPYHYTWNDGSTTQNRTNVISGTYVTTVIDANSCSATASIIVAQPTSALTAAASPNGVYCLGGSNGSMTLHVSGGTSPYSYNWTNGFTSATISNLSSGTYTATVTDANNCVVTATGNVVQPTVAMQAAAGINNIVCYGDANGTININTTGGIAPFIYNWADGANTADRSSLIPGSYSVTVTDALGCTAVVAADITQPAQALKVLTNVNDVSCFSGNNGSINVSVSGGTPPYAFKWNGGSTVQNANNLAAGAYTVSVTDANQCATAKQSIVIEPSALATSLTANAVSCFNGNNGSITANISGGVAPYTYNWGSGLSSQNLSHLTAGNYTVSLTDANGCSTTASVLVTGPQAAVTVSPIVRNVICFGGNTGSIQMNTAGGISPYVYNWAGGGNTQSRNNLPAGTYTVSVSDNSGCSTVASATVNQPSAALTATVTTTNVNCYGNSTGHANVLAAGGTQPYSYNWNSGQTTNQITNLNASSYSVSVLDANGCSVTGSGIVTQPSAALTNTIASLPVKCFGGNTGSINLSVNGGSSPYIYAWSNGGTTQDLANLNAGNYHVTITDNKGCSALASAVITQPSSAINISLNANNVSCHSGNNGSINTTVTGGTSPYSYNWGSGINTANRNNLAAGNYTLSVADANGCTAVSTAAITQPSTVINIDPSITGVSCFGGSNGSIHMSVSGGSPAYNFVWSSGQTTQSISNLAAGIYHVTVSDSHGCTATAAEPLSQPQVSLTANAAAIAEVSCFGGNNGTIQVNVNGGTAPYHYQWNDGVTTQNRNNIAAGNYHITVTDNHGCTVISNISVTQPAASLAIVAQHVNAACYGAASGSITLQVTGGTPVYYYNWGSGVTTQNRSGLVAGSYSVTVADSKGCIAAASVNITQPATGVHVANTVTAVSCFQGDNGAITLNTTGGAAPYTYHWNGGVTTANRSNLSAGNYQVVVTDANGCSVTDDIIITTPSAMVLSATETNPSCYGDQNGAVGVTATGGTPAYRYNWSTGSSASQINTLGAGSFTVTVTDLHGCSASIGNIVLTQPVEINAAVQVVSGSCAGENTGQLTASATGGSAPYQYQWNINKFSASVNNLGAGTYTVTVTDAHQCSQTANALISVLPGVSGNAYTTPLPCKNAKGEILLYITSGTGPYSFKWSDGDTTQNIYQVHPGTYGVTVHDANGCSFDTSFTIENLNNFSVNAIGGGTIKLGSSIEISATGTGSNQTIFNWSPGSTLSCTTCANSMAQPAETTLYTVVGIDTNGCVASDTVSVYVNEDHTVFVPNAFSPNGDGNNDYFQMFGNLAGIHSLEIKIFNRWGEKVFESENPDFKWDGTYKGVLQNPCVFVYEMKIVFQDGHSDGLRKGSITLVR